MVSWIFASFTRKTSIKRSCIRWLSTILCVKIIKQEESNNIARSQIEIRKTFKRLRTGI